MVDSYAFSSVLLDVDRFNVRFHEPQKILDAHLRCPRFSDSFWVLFWVYSIFLFIGFGNFNVFVYIVNREAENGGKSVKRRKKNEVTRKTMIVLHVSDGSLCTVQ